MVKGDAPSVDTASSTASTPGKAVTSIAQLNDPDIKLGLPLSSAADEAVEDQLPLAQLIHYNDNLLGFMDVAQGRIDAFVYDVIGLKISMENGVTGVRMLDETMDRQLSIRVGVSPIQILSTRSVVKIVKIKL
jgi:polar amino acid transport system substrate-binding protein